MARCDCCSLDKPVIIYLRLTRKLCQICYQAEKMTLKSIVNALPDVAPRAAPLGYNFIVNDYFIDQKMGKMYAEHVYTNLSVANS